MTSYQNNHFKISITFDAGWKVFSGETTRTQQGAESSNQLSDDDIPYLNAPPKTLFWAHSMDFSAGSTLTNEWTQIQTLRRENGIDLELEIPSTR